MKYFAYGSNMSSARLRARAPGARALGARSLPQHQLRFHKRGRDGSGKCDAFYTGTREHTVLGVLFELAVGDKPALDRAEGLGRGYDEKRVVVIAPDGSKEEALTYVATDIRDSLRPYSWYLDHVVIGAREWSLPVAYITERILSVGCTPDLDGERDARERAIYE